MIGKDTEFMSVRPVLSVRSITHVVHTMSVALNTQENTERRRNITEKRKWELC